MFCWVIKLVVCMDEFELLWSEIAALICTGFSYDINNLFLLKEAHRENCADFIAVCEDSEFTIWDICLHFYKLRYLRYLICKLVCME